MADKRFYITTPIYYINDIPHIGHAYTSIAADVLSRYRKKMGDDVFFLTGTDEHGAKIEEAAKAAGKAPKEFVDSLVPKFKDTWKKLNVDYTEFFRTSDPEHEKIVSDLILELKKKDLIEKKKYEGLYCIGCERYLKESELEDGLCPDHRKAPVKQSEENYFFKLSSLQDKLMSVIESGELEIAPASRKNEVLGKLKNGIEDVSISRSGVKWGIPFPEDSEQTVYVWFEALLNYFTATKIYKKEDFWPADLHLMAKDILWFHAIVWPAMLLSLDIPLPKKVFAHGFFTVDGKKMSKTLGNVLDPNELADKYGEDAVRYALLREFPFGEDGDISEEKIADRYNKDLANELGNLLQRVLSMINRYEIAIDKRENYFDMNEDVEATVLPEVEVIFHTYMNELKFDQILTEIWRLVRSLNSFVDDKKPWELAKKEAADGKPELTRVLNVCYWQLDKIADLLEVFLPKTSEKMKQQLKDLKPEAIFPRLDK